MEDDAISDSAMKPKDDELEPKDQNIYKVYNTMHPLSDNQSGIDANAYKPISGSFRQGSNA